MAAHGSLVFAGHHVKVDFVHTVVGLHFFNQAFVLDPTANAAGAVLSDAAEAIIGQQ